MNTCHRIVLCATVLLLAAGVGPAHAKSKKKACQQACGSMITACTETATAFGFGQLARGCKKAVLKQCKKGGVETCTGFCGDGQAGAGEACDGGDLAEATCGSLGFASGDLACALDCVYDTSDCVPLPAAATPLCGNGKVDAPESCDGADLAGETCATLGYTLGGTLDCTAGCGYDLTGCVPSPPASSCGNGVIDAGEECDQGNLNGETCADQALFGSGLACGAGCVFDTSGCAVSRFEDTGQTIIDHETGLEWEKKTNGNRDATYSWSVGSFESDRNGTAFTEFLGDGVSGLNAHDELLIGSCFANHCDWRLPTLDELKSILLAPHPCGTSPCIDPIFGPTAASLYCSTTHRSNSVSFFWYVDFSDGTVTNALKHLTACSVRAVRGGS